MIKDEFNNRQSRSQHFWKTSSIICDILGLFSRKTKKDDFQQVNLPEVTLSDGVSHQLAQQVDCTGYSCPRPQMMTKKAVNGAQTNDVM